MIPTIVLTIKEQELGNLIIAVSGLSALPAGIFSTAEKKYLKEQSEKLRQDVVSFNRLSYWIYVYIAKEEKDISRRLEAARRAGDRIAGLLNAQKATGTALFDASGNPDEVLALAEGLSLGSYQFLKYRKEKDHASTLKKVEIYSHALQEEENERASSGLVSRIVMLNVVLEAVSRCRDLVNEPNSYLTAAVFAKEAEKMARESGAVAEVFNRQRMAALKMGGILAVNLGSHEPPTFTVMEWKPADAKNKRPVVLVGKGIVYDTGGMNLKPGDSMLNMKDDMSGAAVVAATVYAVARAGLPVHVIGLMPATDNRPGARAMVSGDIITMHNGMTVEVVNTDAEGRLILADALSYARRYDPSLVIDLATLTGAAARAIGRFGAIAMTSRAGEALLRLMNSGYGVYERLVEFPMWDEYGEQVKSELADLKNLGPPEAGMITAAKFLEKFTDYPYIHLDIAGPSFVDKRDSYRGQGSTGFGVRLLFDFIARSLAGQLPHD